MGKLGGGFTKNLPKEQRAVGDFYPTPECALDVLLAQMWFDGPIWECCSGGGAISKYLEAKGYEVESTEIREGPDVYGRGGVDFLAEDQTRTNIITNPPFCLAEEFIRQGIRLTTGKCAFLLRLAFLESERRYKLFTEFPPAKIVVISRRLPFFHDGKWHATGSTFPHAWLVWDKHDTNTKLSWGMF